VSWKHMLHPGETHTDLPELADSPLTALDPVQE
jgi:hypothetical protein